MMQNPAQLMQQLQRFSQGLRGNPQQMVQQIIQSGRVPQDQLNAIQQQANQIYQMLGGRNNR